MRPWYVYMFTVHMKHYIFHLGKCPRLQQHKQIISHMKWKNMFDASPIFMTLSICVPFGQIKNKNKKTTLLLLFAKPRTVNKLKYSVNHTKSITYSLCNKFIQSCFICKI